MWGNVELGPVQAAALKGAFCLWIGKVNFDVMWAEFFLSALTNRRGEMGVLKTGEEKKGRSFSVLVAHK